MGAEPTGFQECRFLKMFHVFELLLSNEVFKPHGQEYAISL